MGRATSTKTSTKLFALALLLLLAWFVWDSNLFEGYKRRKRRKKKGRRKSGKKNRPAKGTPLYTCYRTCRSITDIPQRRACRKQCRASGGASGGGAAAVAGSGLGGSEDRGGGGGGHGDDRGGNNDSGGGGCDGSGNWLSGQATYYAANEPDVGHGTGPIGSRDNPLIRGTSVATRNGGDFGRRVCIRGLKSMPDGVYRVDDVCAGGGCRDFDVFVGSNMGGGEGVDSIQYKWL